MKIKPFLFLILLTSSHLSQADSVQYYTDLENGNWQGEDQNQYSEAYFSFASQVAEQSISNGDYQQAIEVYRLIQHGIHQYEGVNSPRQIPLIQRLAIVYQKINNKAKGNQQAVFAFHISTKIEDQSIESSLKAYEDLARYYSDYDEVELAIETYLDALAFLKNHPDTEVTHYILPYTGVARLAKTDHLYLSKAITFMEDLDLMLAGAGISLSEKLAVKLELGDLYMLYRDSEKATSLYKQAWQNEYYNSLVSEEFLEPKLIENPRIPIEDSSLYVDVEVNIGEQGRITDYKVLDDDLNRIELKNLKRQMKTDRFRPQMIEGELVARRNVTIRRVRDNTLPNWEPDIEFNM